MNFIYTINPDAEVPEMLIDSHVGADEVNKDTGEVIKGINGSQWAKELLALDDMGKRRVKVYINSPGGSVSDGYSICAAMLNTNCKVDTYCRGLAASIAGVAFMCGRNRVMADYGILMFHDPFGGSNTEALDKMKTSLATIIAARCGLTVETISAIMSRTTFLDLSEALELKMATEPEYSTENNIGRLSPVRNDAKEYWKGSRSIFNSALNLKIETKNNTDMSDLKKINNKLGLMDEASAESREKALDAILNRAEAMNKKAEDAEDKLKKKEDELAKMKSDMEDQAKKNKEAYDALHEEYIKMKNDMDAQNKAAEEAKAAQNKIDAKNLITEAVKLGKIENKAESIEKWTKRAESDLEGVKDLLSTMGVNLKAPNLDNVTEEGKGFRETKNYLKPEDQADHMQDLVLKKMQDVADKNKKK